MMLYHEMLHRGAPILDRLGRRRVAICGAGALGANIAETLVRSGVRNVTVIDRDRVEERNLSTQPYVRSDIGAFKAKVLAAALYRAVGAEVEPVATELNDRNAARLLAGADLVIDTFDNSVARRAVTDWSRARNMPCLHAGLADGYAEIIWNDEYRVPSAANDDVCDYPLARTLAQLASAVTCEVALRFLSDGARPAYTITLDDFAIMPLDAAGSAEADALMVVAGEW